jgi:hypothetical protein
LSQSSLLSENIIHKNNDLVQQIMNFREKMDEHNIGTKKVIDSNAAIK